FSAPLLLAGAVAIVVALFVGSLISWFVKRRIHAASGGRPAALSARLAQAERKGTLFASGLIVGESLIGVVLA
ncbi:MAG: OPT/YSL family transporter, partial [Pollutimonas bauzanensis]